jgi:hypothetical protein
VLTAAQPSGPADKARVGIVGFIGAVLAAAVAL